MGILLAQYDEVNKLKMFQEIPKAYPVYPVVRLCPIAFKADEAFDRLADKSLRDKRIYHCK